MSDSGHQRVAIVVPHHRFPLTEEEEISLRCLRRHLGGYDRFLIGPKSLPDGFDDFQLCPFPARAFRSERAYNSLLLSKSFYVTFRAYDYILIYQMDCLVFADKLMHWCNQGWDYVGAPWFPNCEQDTSKGFWTVGNGGFSLRKVSSFAQVLKSRVLDEDPVVRGQRIRWFGSSQTMLRRLACTVKTCLHAAGYRNNVHWVVKQHCDIATVHEDLFWSFQAKRFVPSFRIPTPVEALDFAFESAPRYCYEANNRKLPFGCHAWTKFDRSFWEEFLEK